MKNIAFFTTLCLSSFVLLVSDVVCDETCSDETCGPKAVLSRLETHNKGALKKSKDYFPDFRKAANNFGAALSDPDAALKRMIEDIIEYIEILQELKAANEEESSSQRKDDVNKWTKKKHAKEAAFSKDLCQQKAISGRENIANACTQYVWLMGAFGAKFSSGILQRFLDLNDVIAADSGQTVGARVVRVVSDTASTAKTAVSNAAKTAKGKLTKK
ncbi:MAG: hypothetical protein LBD36_01200 [Holosporales bacterium]|jgi:Asp-tRNA(Asn)/Glu-tRNA(Gln) amidotransferase C subunit|nr:hypothetical protein [Holosporales bacterium]